MNDLEMPKVAHIQDLTPEERTAHFATIPLPKKITRTHVDLQWFIGGEGGWCDLEQPLHTDQSGARAWLASEINGGALKVGEYMLVRVISKVEPKVVTSTKVVL